jgi:hypothetical protein
VTWLELEQAETRTDVLKGRYQDVSESGTLDRYLHVPRHAKTNRVGAWLTTVPGLVTFGCVSLAGLAGMAALETAVWP